MPLINRVMPSINRLMPLINWKMQLISNSVRNELSVHTVVSSFQHRALIKHRTPIFQSCATRSAGANKPAVGFMPAPCNSPARWLTVSCTSFFQKPATHGLTITGALQLSHSFGFKGPSPRLTTHRSSNIADMLGREGHRNF